MIAADTPSTWIIYNRLVREHGLFPCIIEEAVERRILIRNRIRKLGLFAVLGQIAFVALIRPILRYQASRRIRELCHQFDLEAGQPLTPAIRYVESANSNEAISLLRAADPRIVIVNGTRILKPDVLSSVKAPFINTHQGITPRYRGAHGAYWALHENDRDHCGVTVHFVDEGIDTGNIIGQATIDPQPADSFVTYPFLQTAAALPILRNAIAALRSGKIETSATSGPSAVWYHPTIWEYIRARLRGVR
ncbi:MAG: formyl transferase [Proteobacteria bacterium]|nr:formyl transferase [Pseudomonadota bacterium]